MLRASTADQSADLLVVTEGAARNDGAVPRAAELLVFAEAIHAPTSRIDARIRVLPGEARALGPVPALDQHGRALREEFAA